MAPRHRGRGARQARLRVGSPRPAADCRAHRQPCLLHRGLLDDSTDEGFEEEFSKLEEMLKQQNDDSAQDTDAESEDSDKNKGEDDADGDDADGKDSRED